MQDLNYCHRCGQPLSLKQIDHLERPHCNRCGLTVFLDPKVAVVVLVLLQGKLVLVRRDIDPFMGYWSLPSGYVDRGKLVEDEAIREVKEETCLDVRLKELLGVYSQEGNPVILVTYTAEVVGGALAAGDEVQEVGLFRVDELPPLPFPNDDKIIRDFLASRRRQS